MTQDDQINLKPLNIHHLMLLLADAVKHNRWQMFDRVIEKIEAAPLTAKILKLRLVLPFYQDLRVNFLRYAGALPDLPNSPDENQLEKRLNRLKAELIEQQIWSSTASYLETLWEWYQPLQQGLGLHQLLLQTLCHPWETKRLIDFLAMRIEQRIPTAWIRLGDGEGNFMAYPEEWRSHVQRDRVKGGYIWWGRELTPLEQDRLEYLLREAIAAADFIGIPEPYRLLLGIQVPTPESFTMTDRGARALYVILRSLPEYLNNRQTMPLLTTAYSHYDVELWGGYEQLLHLARAVTLMTRHLDAAERLKTRFRLTRPRLIAIPPEDHFMNPAKAAHFPTLFEKILRELEVREPGELFLVAAGFLGKVYCARIKELGGIALDIGSVIDAWVGQPSRQMHENLRVTLRAYYRTRHKAQYPA